MTVDLSEKVRYDYAEYPIYVRKAYLSLYPNYSAQPHVHEDLEFIAILSGEMSYNVDGKVYRLTEGNGIIVNPMHIHYGYSAEKHECAFVCILISPNLLCTNPAFETNFFRPITNNPAFDCIPLNKDLSWQKDIVDNIISAYEVKDCKSAPIMIQSLILNAWALLNENIDTETKIVSNNTNVLIVKTMIDFIKTNYPEKICLNDIAKSGAVGESKCCKLFKEYTEQTPNMYLTRYRLDKSTEYLKYSDLTIIEIAQSVGFNGSSYFSETFKAKYLMTPKEYRRKYREQ